MLPLYIFDPTATDEMSRVRGVGRYVQILRECLSAEAIFTNNLHDIPFESTLLNPFFDPLKKPLLTKRLARKQIAIIHDLIPLKYPSHFPIGLRGKLNIFLNSLALKQYGHIITDSEASKNDTVRMLKVKAENVHVIHPPIAHIFFESSKTQNRELKTENYFIYVGDATWNKNLVNLAKAIHIADVNCVFVGKVFTTQGVGDRAQGSRNMLGALESNFGKERGQAPPHLWQKELYEFLIIAQNDKRFIFPGYVSDVDLVTLYKNAVANILVSRDEGFGYSYFEAASQSTSSVLSDISVFREIAADTVLFANPNDPTQIADRIQELLASPKLRKELGTKAKERLKTFSKEAFKETLLEIIK